MVLPFHSLADIHDHLYKVLVVEVCTDLADMPGGPEDNH